MLTPAQEPSIAMRKKSEPEWRDAPAKVLIIAPPPRGIY